MSVSSLVAYVAGTIEISYALALSFWAFRVAINRHPLGEKEERWVPWLILVYAVCGIEMPYIALLIAIVCASLVAQAHTLAGVGVAVVLLAAFLWYQYAEQLDDRRFRARHQLGPRS